MFYRTIVTSTICWLFILAFPRIATSQDIKQFVATPLMPQKIGALRTNLAKDLGWRTLLKESERRGFTERKGDDSRWGQTVTMVAESVGEQKITICVFDLTSKKQKGPAALLYLNDGYSSYRALLIGSPKDLDSAKEYFVIKDGKNFKLQEASSWKSCLKKALRSGACGATCASAALYCTGSWAAYLGCVAASCGGCIAVETIACKAKEWWPF